jgi:hypothetical protein
VDERMLNKVSLFFMVLLQETEVVHIIEAQYGPNSDHNNYTTRIIGISVGFIKDAIIYVFHVRVMIKVGEATPILRYTEKKKYLLYVV